MTQALKFEQVLESIESLSIEEQKVLIDLVQRRLAEQRRSEIAANIDRSQEEYQAGKVFRGTVEQIITELRQ